MLKKVSSIHPILLSSLLALASQQSLAAELTVDISGMKSNQDGNLIVQLFKSEKNWMDSDKVLQEQTVKVDARTMTLTFKDIEMSNDYALSIIHDANENGQMDMRWFPFPKPKEGVGLSNNKFSMGQPSFDDAQFSVDQEQSRIALTLKYY